MKFLRSFLDKQRRWFGEGGKLKRLFPMYEALDTFFYTPGKVAKGPTHVRDAIDLKRVMSVVVVALGPAILMALYNTGYQANLVLSKMGDISVSGWRMKLLSALGIGFDPSSLMANVFHGMLYFIPVYVVTFAVGMGWELLFASIRKHEINEGFFVTSFLFPLILPPTTPLWQVAIGISFGVVIGKEVFGGVGMNILNPALTARAFLFFAYPAQISGDAVWVAVDGVSQATPLAAIAEGTSQMAVSWWDAFFGLIPGSMGETSTLACLIGAFILIVTGIGSWRIMLGVLAGMVSFSLALNMIGSSVNPMLAVTPMWHLVLGGFAFGMVFMATDPVSAPMTVKGKYIYGFLIGLLVIVIRVLNPAFPEGMMLAILFCNILAPVIDKLFISANIRRRLRRNGI